MKKIFKYLMNLYGRNEEGRLIIFSELHNKVSDEYREQTTFGNVYNANIEFLMSNELFNRLVKENDDYGLAMLKNGINHSFDDAVTFTKNEQP